MALAGEHPHVDTGPTRLMSANVRLRRQLEQLRQEAESLRAERDQAAELVQTKSELLAHMSHELRTPMNGILGMTQLALQTELSAQQREYLEVARSSAHSLLTLINDILDLSRVESGRLRLEAIPFDLRDTVHNAVRSLAVLATEKNLRLEHAIADDVPEGLVGDAGRLRQILLNLVGNAIKFTDHGSVEVGVSVARLAPSAVELAFEVRDTGIGIEPDRQAAVFEPFLQASDSTARTRGGTGLGLSICSQLVELMSGRMWLESEPGLGSTFHFTAHFEIQHETATVDLTDPSRLTGLEVFVVAGDRAEAVAEHLRSLDARPQAVTGLQLVDADARLVLIDLDRYGFEDIAAVRHRWSDARVMVLTSSGQRGDAARCRELDIDAYLTRPVDLRDLRDAARAVLAKDDDVLVTRHWLRERRKRQRILVADDSETNRRVVAQMLERHDHLVVEVADGLAALAMCGEQTFDLILMDVEMPGMNGVEAAAALREEGVAVPIVALTGHVEGDLLAGSEFDAHLVKPFEFNELLELVESLSQ